MGGKIRIEWLTDQFDCDQGGCSGGYATGAHVYRDGEEWFRLTPSAGCYGGESWNETEVFTEILSRLGFEIDTSY